MSTLNSMLETSAKNYTAGERVLDAEFAAFVNSWIKHSEDRNMKDAVAVYDDFQSEFGRVGTETAKHLYFMMSNLQRNKQQGNKLTKLIRLSQALLEIPENFEKFNNLSRMNQSEIFINLDSFMLSRAVPVKKFLNPVRLHSYLTALEISKHQSVFLSKAALPQDCPSDRDQNAVIIKHWPKSSRIFRKIAEEYCRRNFESNIDSLSTLPILYYLSSAYGEDDLLEIMRRSLTENVKFSDDVLLRLLNSWETVKHEPLSWSLEIASDLKNGNMSRLPQNIAAA